jgi:hypothetical protein
MTRYELYDGNHILEFEPGQHKYFLDGTHIPSVTTILGEKSKPFLKAWAAKVTVEAMAQVLKPGISLSEVRIKAMLDHAKGAIWRVLNEAGTIGTIVHDWIEAYIQHQIETGKKLTVSDPGEVRKNCIALPHTEEAISSIYAFLDWEEEHDIEYLASEYKVVSINDWWAGTSDLAFMIDGVRAIGDWKTSKGIYPEYFVQGATYAMGSVEMGMEPFEEVWIMRIPKDGNGFEAKSHKDLKNFYTIEELYSEIFLSLRKVYEWNNGSNRRQPKYK